jgi:thiol-disulfide isomerase/thioredoxin
VSRRLVSLLVRTSPLAMAAAVLLAPPPASAKAAKGQRAPGFNLSSLKGDKISLSGLAGQVVVVDFWAQWCGPCKEELPQLDKLQKEYAGKGVKIITVNIDKQRDNAEKLVKMLGLSLEVLLDPSGSVAASYDLPKMPSSYVVDKKGVIRYVHEGFESGDVARFKKELDELVK